MELTLLKQTVETIHALQIKQETRELTPQPTISTTLPATSHPSTFALSFSGNFLVQLIGWRNAHLSNSTVKNFLYSTAASLGAGVLSLTSVIEGIVRDIFSLLYQITSRKTDTFYKNFSRGIFLGLSGTCLIVSCLAINTKVVYLNRVSRHFPILWNLLKEDRRGTRALISHQTSSLKKRIIALEANSRGNTKSFHTPPYRKGPFLAGASPAHLTNLSSKGFKIESPLTHNIRAIWSSPGHTTAIVGSLTYDQDE